MAKSKKRTIGIVGYGSAGQRYASLLGRLGNEIDVYDPRVSPDLDWFLGQRHEAWVIACPAAYHLEWIQRAADRGMNMLIEKPLVAQADVRALPLVKRSQLGPVVMVGYNWVNHGGIHEIAENHFDPDSVVIRLTTNMKTWPGWTRGSYGLPIFECSHELAILRMWFGRLTIESVLGEPSLGVVDGTSEGGTRWAFVWNAVEENTKNHGRRWIINRRDEYHIPPHGAELDMSYEITANIFNDSLIDGEQHRLGYTFDMAAEVAELCNEIAEKQCELV